MSDPAPVSALGVVETRTFTFGERDPLVLASGQTLGPVTLAYETYGALSPDKSNAVLLLHALTGDAHAAGLHAGEPRPGWWDPLVGPGKAFDTDKYFVVCSNVIGGCRGSTGPGAASAALGGKPYGITFPVITIADMVEAQRRLMDHLGVPAWLAVSGGSMGGMQALQWAASYPDRVRSVIPIATTLKHSPQQIAFDEVGRQAVMADPDWLGGNYYDHGQPERGLAVARMIGHITYMSDQSMEEKFSRRLKNEGFKFSFDAEFEVEGYLRYRGANFVRRFDANSYLYVTRAMDYFDLSGEKLFKPGAPVPRYLVISFKSDWLYPSYQSRDIVAAVRAHRGDVTYVEVHSTYGHDAFLVEYDEQTRLIKSFLAKTREGA
ncbi:MAG: homoserine O-acetyltransferase [Elusimicrobia bacterium]|jgi:homoserine O-acetyltransferase|nr:homoserine O-acetyltransferase [Elusimicrobiota bacterium]MBK7207776.1 homoserine O-acetyltransferase [Elusimicrobiota bacterium]MBK7544538.1 homoserine O-acetyltransferase [Elusimicrobiota bacterium]MBK7574063.1 homoserine O-acetyltransferase [Elusimicrobiota bacterium]MBK7688990.1 homoserine O-acetyltransferase [Elusimicrobiota bacterium]